MCVQLSATPWTVARQAPLSVGFSRQEYWSGLPCPSPGGFPDPRVEPGSLALQADSLLAGLRGEPEGRSWCAVSVLMAWRSHCVDGAPFITHLPAMAFGLSPL